MVNDDHALHEPSSVLVNDQAIVARQKGKPLKPAPAPPKSAPAPPKPVPAPGTRQNVVPLPYKKKPRPTSAYNVCDFEGYTCLNNVVPGDLPENSPISAAPILKRSSTRKPFTITLASGKLEMASKPYWSSGELFDDAKDGKLNLKEAWIDFAKDSMSVYKVKTFSSKHPQPTRPALPHDYITEHIVEAWQRPEERPKESQSF